MKRTKIKSGDLLRIPLWNNFGFAYAKYIDLRKFSDADMVFLIKVYDHWTKTKEFDIEKIKQSAYLIQPILVAGIMPTLRQELWEVVGNIGIIEEDLLIPHFKTWGPPGVNEWDAKKWYYIIGSNLSNKFEAPYENIKHLEGWSSQGTGNIEIRITMQLLIKEGLNVNDYFDLEDETFKYQYKKALEIPLLSKLSPELWGKAKV